MAGVLEPLKRPQKRSVENCTVVMRPKAPELEASREILAEVFDVRPSEEGDMIRCCCEAENSNSKKEGRWPEGYF
jgi:hypothetical protein